MSRAHRIGPYELIAPLGAGGMAETHLAVRRGPGGFEQRVCLKRIRHDFEGDPELVRQFLAEASIAASLRHATIAQVLDFGHDGDDYYLALELVDGLDLHHLLHRLDGPLDPGLTLYLATELATALDVAHRAPSGGIVHRDVSPSNVLISTEGEVKLTDFGIARAAEGPTHTRTGIVKGKVPYMAPEYARNARFDARCDLFGLGVLLYECLAGGTRPYDGSTDLETLERATRGDHRSLAELAPDAPAGLIDLVERLIEPEPALRLQSAAELLDALVDIEGTPASRRDLGALVRRLGPAQPKASVHQTLGYAEGAETVAAGGRADAPADVGSGGAQPPTRTRLEPPRWHPAGGRGRLLPWLSLGLALLALGTFAYALVGSRGDATGGRAATPAAPTTASMPAAAGGGVAGGGAEPRSRSPAPAAEPEGRHDGPVQVGETEPEGRGDGPVRVGEAEPGKRALPPRRKASLEVIVMPYGEVLVDGRPLGTSPARLTLPPGEHLVEGKGPGILARRRVTLSPGQHRKIVLR